MSASEEHFSQPLHFQHHPRNSNHPSSAPRPAGAPAQKPPLKAHHTPLKWRIFDLFLDIFIGLLLASVAVTASFIWFMPASTSFMRGNPDQPVIQQSVALNHISRFVIAATIAHEDQQLGTRVGAFSMAEMWERADAYIKGEDDPSGSTIPQQLAKNMFLTPDQNAVRKGLEAFIATEFSLILSDQRVMELYLNFAQFGPRIYGICAASWYYFDSPPYSVTEYQAAQLMGVLPTPINVERAPGGGILVDETAHINAWEYVNGAANVHVPRQIKNMGGWKKAVATIGITDEASDHKADRLPGTPGFKDACTTPPAGVIQLLKDQGVKLDTEGHPIKKGE